MEIKNGRIIIPLSELSKEEKDRLLQVWDMKYRRTGEINIEDCWINRIILGIDIERAEYIAQDAVDGLLDFQRADVKRLATYGNMLDANPMGLGKTIESLATFKAMRLHTAVVFTKKSCITQWVETIKEWLPGIRVFAFSGTGQRIPNLNDVDIVVTNYEKVQGRREDKRTTTGMSRRITSLSNFGEWLCGRLWDMIIFDEIHLVKNHEGIRHRLVNQIPSKFRLGLSGTPITKHPDDVYGIFKLLEPKSVGSSYWTFANYVCEIEDGFWGRKPVGLTRVPEKQEVFFKLWNMLTVFNAREDVLKDLPEISENLILLDMEPKQRKIYGDVQKLLLDELPSDCTVQNGMMKTLRLQQVTTCPKLFEGMGWGPKFEFIADWLKDEPDMRTLIVSPYERHIHLLHDYLISEGIECDMYSGKLSDTRRADSLTKFKESGARVLCATIGAIGTGTDGLQHNCHNIIILDRSWGPEEMRQVISRLYRMGQKEKVFAYYLECAKSVDQHIGKTVIKKLQDIRRIVEGKEDTVVDYHLF